MKINLPRNYKDFYTVTQAEQCLEYARQYRASFDSARDMAASINEDVKTAAHHIADELGDFVKRAHLVELTVEQCITAGYTPDTGFATLMLDLDIVCSRHFIHAVVPLCEIWSTEHDRPYKQAYVEVFELKE